jgi:diguanylate cyclase (GGDEF)-like protein
VRQESRTLRPLGRLGSGETVTLLDSTTTWIAVGLAVGAAALALLAIVVAALVARGRRRALKAGADALAASQAGLEARLAELEAALEEARETGRRTELTGGIRESLELDAVVSRTLEAAAGLEGVDAVLVLLPNTESEDGQRPYIASTGLADPVEAVQPIAGPPDGRLARTVSLSYRYDGSGGNGDLIKGGLAVPLGGEEEQRLGTLAVFWRSDQPEPGEALVQTVEELAAVAGPAIENARKFREARQLADLDALTTLHNRRFFHETLGHEVARAARYGRGLALVVFDVDDFKAINDRVGHLAGDALLAEIGERVRSVVRSADVPCRVGGDEFAVILPEATIGDAEQLYRRLQFAVSSRPGATNDRLHLSAGIAELEADDTAISLFERADEALYRAKGAGKGRAVAAEPGR